MNSPIYQLEINNLSVKYKKFEQDIVALHDVSFRIKQGEWVILYGDNGSGKSTLLKVIANQITKSAYSSGTVSLCKHSLHAWKQKDLSNYLFSVQQTPILGTIADFTVFENLKVALSDWSDKKQTYYREQLEKINLAQQTKQLAKYLSGGQQQLLAILIATLRKPKLLILDEPFAALDEGKKQIAIRLLQELNNENTTIFMVSHDKKWITAQKEIHLLELKKGQIIIDTLQ
ncbi:MAG: hypothetical protein RLZZ292_3813 [Bacteroidota bacterium]|jgi:ABC-type multidrug transport system ATPase subunit